MENVNHLHTGEKTIYLEGREIGTYEATGDLEVDAQNIQEILKEKGLHKEASTTEHMHGQANSFAHTANKLYNQDLKSFPRNGSAIAPFITNATFSIELYLKTILLASDDTTMRTHDLLKLYQSIPSEAQQVILKSAGDVKPLYKLEIDTDLSSSLRSLRDAFEKWRYVHENNGATTDIQSIRYVMHVLHEACCRIMEVK